MANRTPAVKYPEHSFSRFYTLIFIPFLALMPFYSLVTTYISACYKADNKNPLHILLHNSKTRINRYPLGAF